MQEPDPPSIEEGIRLVLEGIGEDVGRPGLKETPRRVAQMYGEIFAGMQEDPESVIDVTFDEGHDEMIMVRDIWMASVCEHHLIPFVGKAHVAYIPNVDGRITGLSKVARLVEVLARRPQVQERLTTQIAEVLERALSPRGVFVVIEAEHLCMSMRGVKKPGSVTVTSAVRGVFKTDARTRAEAMSLIRSESR
ncbi:MAG TPA: GTP cyclohydrolase I FolE [Actinomycetota bacterium]|jgi:GTP cyclohydrolase I|nr:GTP cyclohydrolase I FolE [Actinomycetota bacterium]